ncbi:HD family phosphohydrolase [Leptospira kobayashii]|uniref:HD family phosphohydrolase n=1 Tax=Leptospira kobayashii TaxID=1917830 RepID=A0ABM7UH39_9LEPT|nr:HDOD domain-containing protein [Leptospira kobayashii]BDA77848.1 HD family phosphohydrolase [Leptospira kobayashii]
MSAAKPLPLEYKDSLGMHSNIPDINHPIQENLPFHFKFFNINEHIENTLYQTLDRFLLQLDIVFIRDSVLAAVKETVTNAVKANVKRVYFNTLQSDIQNSADYQNKMIDFKKSYFDNRDEFEEGLLKYNYGVFVSFIHNKTMMRIRIMNNVELTEEESSRIKLRLEKAKTYNDLAEAYMDVSSDQEGAGLGLIMTLMMLKNDGLGDSAFKFESSGNKTIFMIDVPTQMAKDNAKILKADKIISELDQLPTFPKTIQDIQAAIEKPNSSIGQIAEMIKKDISLSANILKLSNSAAFNRGGRVETLDRAIQLIGLKELQSLLYSLGTKQILEDKFPAFQAIWDKSNECAFYCKWIAGKMGMPKNTMSNLLSASLLHDIGEILLVSFESEKMGQIKSYSTSKEIASAISLEEASFGITHTKLGALVAEKWNFPEVYASAMEYHHRPLLVEEMYKEIVYPIYLGDMMIMINQREAKSSEIPKEVLNFCKFATVGEFDSARIKLKEHHQKL